MTLGELINGTGLDEYGIYKKVLADLAGKCVVASGSNYVRFGDGTQICWGEVLDVPTGTFITFPLAFSAIPRFIMTRQYGAPTGGAAQSVWGYNTSNTGTYIGGEINIYSHWLAIGRWK